jgi:membrane-associated phospholipid phosphatase
VLAIIFVLTFLLPSLATGVLYWFGQVESVTLPERRQRPLPFLVAVVSFAAAMLVLRQAGDAFDPLLNQMMAGMTLAVLLTFLISLRWKISAHGVGVGGALGFLSVLQMSALSGESGVWWLIAIILLAGSVMSARLALNVHTPAQVWAGLTLGVSVVLGFGLGLAMG